MFKTFSKPSIALVLFIAFFTLLWHPGYASKKPSVALVLGGGAARGFSHIGLIQAFEDNGIPIDYLVGTSMGSIVSGLYAAGYSVENMKTIVNNLELASLIDILIPPKGGFINTTRLEQYLNVLLHQQSFAELKTPFYSVITRLDTGEELALNHGKVSQAIQASMSIPVLFPAVSIDNVHYVDGGMKNAVPVNVASNLGADVIIGVDVKKELEEINYDSVLNNLQLAMWFMIDGYVELNTSSADVIIVPDVKYDSYMDYQKADLFIEAGYSAGIEYMEEIKEAILTLEPDFDFTPYRQSGYSEEYLLNIIAEANDTALRARRPLTVTPLFQQAIDNTWKLGVQLSYGPLSWFNLGYRYGFSPTIGGHEMFLGWTQPKRVGFELFIRNIATKKQPTIGLELDLPLSKKLNLRADYQINGPYQWQVSLVDKEIIQYSNFVLSSGLTFTGKKVEDENLTFVDFQNHLKLYLAKDYLPFMEITLARPFIYGELKVGSLLTQWNPTPTYQVGIGSDFRLFGMYPFSLNLGVVQEPDKARQWRFSMFKEGF